MPRINEHKFIFENIDYKLTFYPKESPVIYKNDQNYTGNKTELLKKYIMYLGLDFNLNGLTTQQLSSMVLKHFSEQKNSDIKKASQKVELMKKERPNISDKPSKMNLKIELENLGLSKKIKVVLVCANNKNDSYFTNYQNVKFFDTSNHQANEFRPDDNITSQNTWRTYLIEQQLDVNLKRAYQLYSRNEYNCLYNKFKNDFYILSAGWGLVKSEFRLPKYDITFSNGKKVPINTRRNRNIAAAPVYEDFNQLEVNDKEDIFFIGGKEYLKLFYKLTQGLENRKIIFYYGLDNCPTPIVNQNTFIFINYPSTDNRRWHYEVARLFCNSILP